MEFSAQEYITLLLSNMICITFNASDSDTSPALLFKAYCLRPPSESCSYGPCPNPDVTGFGQQFSVFTSAIACSIAIVCCPRLVRRTLYAHMGLMYSLMAAAGVSILLGELTQNDGIFVLLTIASPVSIYLWAATVFSVWWPGVFPLSTNSHSSSEVRLLKALSLLSMVFEGAMACVILLPRDHVLFSQPACDTGTYARRLWIGLLWELSYIMQALWILPIGTACYLLSKSNAQIVEEVRDPEAKKTTQQSGTLDLSGWTENILKEYTGFDIQGDLNAAVLATIQLIALPNIGHRVWNQNLLAAMILCAGLASTSLLVETGTFSYYTIAINRLLAFLLVICLLCLEILLLYVPNIPDIVIVMVVLVACWKQPPLSERFWRNWSYRFIILLGSLISLAAGGFAWFLAALLSAQDSLCPFSLNLFSVSVWLASWLSNSVRSGESYSVRQIWDGVMRRNHMFRAYALILAPNTLWIQACISSNPTQSTSITFGQTFSVITSLVCVFWLVEELWHVKAATWRAILKSEQLPAAAEDEVVTKIIQQAVET